MPGMGAAMPAASPTRTAAAAGAAPAPAAQTSGAVGAPGATATPLPRTGPGTSHLLLPLAGFSLALAGLSLIGAAGRRRGWPAS